MSKEELLLKIFDSAEDAMNELNNFLEDIDNDLFHSETRGNYQNLKVVGNRIYE